MQEKPMKPLMPRDMAGSMQFEGGTGGILRMVSFGGFMEIYKVDATMKVYSPDYVDPERTNPNAPWSTTHAPQAGCSNPIVARMIVQSEDATKMLMGGNETRESFMMLMWKIKEALLACEGLAKPAVESILAKCDEIKVMRINPLAPKWNPFPSVEGLTLAAQSFLNQANRVARLISAMPNQVLPLQMQHKNFDKLAVELEKIVPGSKLLELVKAYAPFIRRIADLRNFEEHDSEETKKTLINDFKLMKNGVGITVPQWGFEGELVSIADDMPHLIDYLLGIAEEMFFILLLEHGKKHAIPSYVTPARPNPGCPVRYEIQFDLRGMQGPGSV